MKRPLLRAQALALLAQVGERSVRLSESLEDALRGVPHPHIRRELLSPEECRRALDPFPT